MRKENFRAFCGLRTLWEVQWMLWTTESVIAGVWLPCKDTPMIAWYHTLSLLQVSCCSLSVSFIFSFVCKSKNKNKTTTVSGCELLYRFYYLIFTGSIALSLPVLSPWRASLARAF